MKLRNPSPEPHTKLLKAVEAAEKLTGPDAELIRIVASAALLNLQARQQQGGRSKERPLSLGTMRRVLGSCYGGTDRRIKGALWALADCFANPGPNELYLLERLARVSSPLLDVRVDLWGLKAPTTFKTPPK